MKKQIGGIGIALLFVALGGLAWAAGAASAPEAGDGPAVTVLAVFEVEGMTCGGCAAGLEKMLAGLDGIETARVSYEEGRAYVELDPAKIEPEQLAAGMSRAGLEATFLPEESGAGGHVAAPHQCAPGCAEHDHGSATAAHAAAGCTAHDHGPAGSATPQLADGEMEQVVTYVVSRLAAGDAPTAIGGDEIAGATGVEVPESDVYRLQNEVIARLREEHPALLASLTKTSRCHEYGACSLRGNLAGASGDILEMYEREKKEDGLRYDGDVLPDFEARDLSGNVVRASDLRGQPAVIVLLAGHCTHCHDSLPILQEAVDTWGPQGVRVVGIVVNSGSVKDVNEWLPLTNPRYEVWVDNDESIGDLLGSHLVPAYFFVAPDGRLTEKLVGFKEKAVVLESVGDLARSTGSGGGDTAAALGTR